MLLMPSDGLDLGIKPIPEFLSFAVSAILAFVSALDLLLTCLDSGSTHVYTHSHAHICNTELQRLAVNSKRGSTQLPHLTYELPCYCHGVETGALHNYKDRLRGKIYE
jgi:hypothetical protein